MKWILFFLLSSCATGELMHGDTAFTVSERIAILSGRDFVATHVGVQPPDIVWDGPDGPNVILRKLNAGGHAVVRGDYIDIGVGPGCISLEEVAAHEFGHHFGLVHIRVQDPGIMNPICGELVWTDADEAACKIQGLCR